MAVGFRQNVVEAIPSLKAAKKTAKDYHNNNYKNYTNYNINMWEINGTLYGPGID